MIYLISYKDSGVVDFIGAFAVSAGFGSEELCRFFGFFSETFFILFFIFIFFSYFFEWQDPIMQAQSMRRTYEKKMDDYSIIMVKAIADRCREIEMKVLKIASTSPFLEKLPRLHLFSKNCLDLKHFQTRRGFCGGAP